MKLLWANFAKGRKRAVESFRNFLKEVAIFEDLTGRELAAIERILHQREYHQDEYIFRQGEPGLGMYIIQEGTVSVIDESTGQHITDLEAGEFFGDLAMLREAPRMASVRAKTPCSILGFFQPDLLNLIERNPSLGVKVVLRLSSIVAERLIKAIEQLVAMKDQLAALTPAKQDEVQTG